jgi:hypothetical protein
MEEMLMKRKIAAEATVQALKVYQRPFATSIGLLGTLVELDRMINVCDWQESREATSAEAMLAKSQAEAEAWTKGTKCTCRKTLCGSVLVAIRFVRYRTHAVRGSVSQ